MEVKFNALINGQGLYATKVYLKGDTVFTLSGVCFYKPSRETIHIGNNIHILDDCGQFINHSFEPSTFINGYKVIALRDIEPNDEITFNYNDTELLMASPFNVDGKYVCGSNTNLK